jgi:hypothetical protein
MSAVSQKAEEQQLQQPTSKKPSSLLTRSGDSNTSGDHTRRAHFENMTDDQNELDENSSERACEEDQLEFKKRQRRRSSVAKLPKACAGLRRASTGSGADSCCKF